MRLLRLCCSPLPPLAALLLTAIHRCCCSALVLPWNEQEPLLLRRAQTLHACANWAGTNAGKRKSRPTPRTQRQRLPPKTCTSSSTVTVAPQRFMRCVDLRLREPTTGPPRASCSACRERTEAMSAAATAAAAGTQHITQVLRWRWLGLGWRAPVRRRCEREWHEARAFRHATRLVGSRLPSSRHPRAPLMSNLADCAALYSWLLQEEERHVATARSQYGQRRSRSSTGNPGRPACNAASGYKPNCRIGINLQEPPRADPVPLIART
jgi:hypothetical protein